MTTSINRIKFKTLKSTYNSFEVLDDNIDLSTNNLILVNGFKKNSDEICLWIWYKVVNQNDYIIGNNNTNNYSLENNDVLEKIYQHLQSFKNDISKAEKEILKLI